MTNVRFFLVLLACSSLGIATFLHYRLAHQDFSADLGRLSDAANIVPIAVIGSGPGGLNAGMYGARAGVYTVVFAGRKPGGQLTETTYVENWPGIVRKLGTDIMKDNKVQAQRAGAFIVPESITQLNLSSWPYTLTTEDGVTIHALSVVLATGSNPRMLSDTRPVPGEREYWGFGVTSCAVCDAPFYKGKDVVVIGGGDSAVEEATLLAAYASSVTMLVRKERMRAAAVMQERLKDYPKISVRYNTTVKEVLGDGKVVTGVHIISEGKEEKLDVEGVFLAIGHEPNTELFQDAVHLTPEKTIALNDRTQKTNVPGVFAAGDIADSRYRQAGVAAGNGIKAGLDALAFLQEQGISTKVLADHEDRYYDPTPEQDLPTPETVISTQAFDKDLSAEQFTVVQVGAEQCVGCAILAPVVRSVAALFPGTIALKYFDTNRTPQELIKKYEVRSIPSLLIFKRDKLHARYDQQLFSKQELYTVLQNLRGVEQHA